MSLIKSCFCYQRVQLQIKLFDIFTVRNTGELRSKGGGGGVNPFHNEDPNTNHLQSRLIQKTGFYQSSIKNTHGPLENQTLID